MDVKIDESWKEILSDEFDKSYFKQIVTHLKTEKSLGTTIYPPGAFIFNAFNSTPFFNVKVVILGQDPYHGPGQAHGLSFSVPKGITKLPPSLQNIFKEIRSDIGVSMPTDCGDLSKWASQGVLLLNASLTVKAGEPNSHSRFGWTDFTDAVIKKISDEKSGVVFILWGNFAQQKMPLIDQSKHLILKAAHPSPFSVEKGFFGCRHFSKTNDYLVKNGKTPIDWKID
jgi:uracil-DNA glycosylase